MCEDPEGTCCVEEWADGLSLGSLRKAELQTLLDLNGVGAAEMRWSREGDKDGKECVFMEIDLPSEVSCCCEHERWWIER